MTGIVIKILIVSNHQINGTLLCDDSVKLVSIHTFDVTDDSVLKVVSAVHIVPSH